MFESLSEKLEKAFKTLKGKGSISEINVAQTMKEIRKALIKADVDFKTAKSFTENVKQKALGQQVLTAVEPGQLLTKIMKDELVYYENNKKNVQKAISNLKIIKSNENYSEDIKKWNVNRQTNNSNVYCNFNDISIIYRMKSIR